MKKELGTFIELGSVNMIESLLDSGLDYVLIDTEHESFDPDKVIAMIRAAEKSHITPYVRIPDTQRCHVMSMLDIGAEALVIPYIKTMDQIHDLVRYGKFAPIGERGYCTTRTYAWGNPEKFKNVSIKEYMAERNEHVKLYPQCETKEALEIIEEIVNTDGIDGIFVGPCDLSISLGMPLEFDNPVFLAAVRRVVKACKDAGKKSIIFAGNMQAAKFWLNEGFDSITYANEAYVLYTGYQAISKEFHS